MDVLEISANVVNLTSVYLAARNSIHTWWLGVIGCVLFAVLFFRVNLYADVTLQMFFIITSFIGWYRWVRGDSHSDAQRPITRTPRSLFFLLLLLSIICAGAYGLLLHRFTDAYAPFIDSFVLSASILAQFLLMNRKVENWLVWVLVNIVSVPLYLSRDLPLTAFVYSAFLINAVFGYRRWRRELESARLPAKLIVG